jgi:uncharacterized protein (TIGR03435 family)
MPTVTPIGALWFAFLMTALAQGATDSAGVQPNATQAASDQVQSYEVVSIRPNKTGSSPGGTRSLPDGFVWTNIPLSLLVDGAYGIRLGSQISGMPGWAEVDKYDIAAKVNAETAERWKKLSRKERLQEEQPMMRSVLAERCRFKAHEEMKELPVYDLVIAKGGLKMKESPPNEEAMEMMSDGQMTAHAQTAGTIASTFAGEDGRLIVDKTGLGDRKFDFEIEWTPEDRSSADNSAPSLLTAFEEQLGLKLVPAKGPVKVLIIDHMERPSPN